MDAEYVRRETLALEHFSSKVPHENVVKVVDVLDVAPYRSQIQEIPKMEHARVLAGYVLELALMNLRSFMLRNCNVVELSMVRYMLKGILAGITHLHRNAFIHRDLKPENIVIVTDCTTSRLVPKIADLGSSQMADNARTRGLCTALYRAPELFMEVHRASLDAANRGGQLRRGRQAQVRRRGGRLELRRHSGGVVVGRAPVALQKR